MMNAPLARALLFAVAAGLMTAASATAETKGSPSMVTGGITSQPIGHYEFCQKYADDCNIRSKVTPPPRVTEYGWGVIREINTSVNTTIVAMTDQEIYGKDEVWEYPTTAGDCEDFVLLKRKKLIERGFSVADLLITVVRKPDGEGHAVLTLRTTDGDYILDNLTDDVKLWTDTNYTYLKRQASFNTGRWVSIEDGRDVLVGALR
ncbi:transglutaminase-like cysteine peptidase [Agrobacterium salinitolerans]|jgi:predicted transglutaminase-like cysteine proteinase|uniref:Transglutaminase n=1 Tax=Agrobacterium salinitolerans TaxID=1183413 RepID=A0A9X3KPW0_9HYPH|nr:MULTISPECIES: transglutaminase-like cysteine peptidase [Agrobacterium]MCZ7850884.1 transglutaminase-like cysteine peptidase [Agrobacterium salinitolerans]MCZ7856576.1 transglutaminase-like cysteine peptidase [Agrobacterium salinitolerans]MCZ7892520.1 transglutaminase-like cysteine peptidase [Agrobacterium salinitolerans]MCZ7938819.1 transglutaminase-like cysteine peptidase [Agrobacterium salinitolerans]MCZ7974546.1 transglutaminase-like cysteine peptidase [Agrobacterium salinitolerans]